MTLLRVRTEIDDRPGRLAVLTAALAAQGANILDLSVQVSTDGVVDEFVIDVPVTAAVGVAGAITAAGGRRTRAVPAAPDELIDETTTALNLAARARSNPRQLPQILAELLRADTAAWITGPEAPEAQGAAWSAGRAAPDAPGAPGAVWSAGRAAPDAPGVPGAAWSAGRAASEALDAAARVGGRPAPEAQDTASLTVPVGPRRAVRLRRDGLPFTLTEAARAGALVRSILPPDGQVPTSCGVTLRDGTRVVVRPLEITDLDAVREMHDRCSQESRRLRYFSVKPQLPRRLVEVFCDRSHGLTVVAEGPDGSVLALAHLMYTLDPGVGELAFLVEDDWQGRGLGSALAGRLTGLALEHGLAELRATVLSENKAMRRLLVGLGGRMRPGADPGVVEARIPLRTQVAA
jgi:RimJ/RimL family protein N-acetyltransferase